MPPLDYPGPVLGAPLPIELHNTVYASRGQRRDGLADTQGLRAWLDAIAGDLPVPAQAIDAAQTVAFAGLRDAVRDALRAAIAHEPVPAQARRVLNAAAAACPRSAQLAADGTRRIRYHAEDATATAMAAIASDTIVLVSGSRVDDIRACGAPGCVLVYLRDHPRRAWCSPACGNRARQARHYARHRSLSAAEGSA